MVTMGSSGTCGFGTEDLEQMFEHLWIHQPGLFWEYWHEFQAEMGRVNHEEVPVCIENLGSHEPDTGPPCPRGSPVAGLCRTGCGYCDGWAEIPVEDQLDQFHGEETRGDHQRMWKVPGCAGRFTRRRREPDFSEPGTNNHLLHLSGVPRAPSESIHSPLDFLFAQWLPGVQAAVSASLCGDPVHGPLCCADPIPMSIKPFTRSENFDALMAAHAARHESVSWRRHPLRWLWRWYLETLD